MFSKFVMVTFAFVGSSAFRLRRSVVAADISQHDDVLVGATICNARAQFDGHVEDEDAQDSEGASNGDVPLRRHSGKQRLGTKGGVRDRTEGKTDRRLPPIVAQNVENAFAMDMCNAAPEWGSCSSHVNYILSRVEDVKVNIGVLILRAEKRFSTSCAPVHHLMTTVFTW